jgi:hypothetical protein
MKLVGTILQKNLKVQFPMNSIPKDETCKKKKNNTQYKKDLSELKLTNQTHDSSHACHWT